MSDEREDRENRIWWNLLKGLPSPLVLLVVTQTAALIWYAAQFTFEQRQQATRLGAVEMSLNKIVDSSNAAAGPAAVAAARLSVMEVQVNQLQAQMERVRDQLRNTK